MLAGIDGILHSVSVRSFSVFWDRRRSTRSCAWESSFIAVSSCLVADANSYKKKSAYKLSDKDTATIHVTFTTVTATAAATTTTTMTTTLTLKLPPLLSLLLFLLLLLLFPLRPLLRSLVSCPKNQTRTNQNKETGKKANLSPWKSSGPG